MSRASRREVLVLVSMLVFACSALAAEKKFSVLVSAGDYERRQTVVSFRLPPEAGTPAAVRNASGATAVIQVDSDRQAWFVVNQLAKGAQATYEPVTEPIKFEHTVVRVEREKGKLHFNLNGRHFLDYQAEPSELPRANIDPVFQRGAYLHPVATLSGKVVTDHYPPNHLHQDGIFFAWTKTEFQGRQPDFWNLKDKKGRVEFAAVGKTWDGPVQGGFTSTHRFVDLTSGEPKVALNETWLIQAYNNPSATCWIFDLTSTQTCAGTDALKLPKYHYGGFGLRGNWAWNGKDQCSFLTSEGETDRIKANESKTRWCDLWGKVEGADAGIAVLGHPENFRAPQPLRVHPGEPYISFAPQQSGEFAIAPGQEYITRFRFVVHDGKPDVAELERLWNDYAHPPTVAVK